MFKFLNKNEYGVLVSHHVCDTCGQEYSICPAPSNYEYWNNCLTEGCDSYDPHRDADILFMTNEEISKEKKVISISKLRERKGIMK